ncbi:MAG: DUF502 domain-containing protein [Bacteroidota bacterium]|nr:DUF502 domain-containing protein [Bacteroidota bacterium]
MNKFKNSVRRKNIINRLLNYFLKGLLISLPLTATVAGIFWLFTTVDNFLGEDHFPGLGILIILSVILVVGVIGSSYIVQPFINWFEEWLEKTPGVKFLYSSVKDIVEAFVGEKKKFSKPVMVEMNGEGIYKIGFVTIKDLTKLNMEGFSGVYFPKSYGFMGDLYFVENSKIKPINANPTAVFKMIVSGGVTGFDEQDA